MREKRRFASESKWRKGNDQKNEMQQVRIRCIRKFMALTLMCVFISGIITGCSSKKDSKDTDTDTKTVIVGTGNAYEPYCYLDEDGNLAGYEYEVLKRVDELLPQYEFKYETYDFANVLIALDSGKIDLGAHQYELNEERQEKYLFSTESYTTYITYITVAAGNNEIKSIDDLQGKKVKSSTGSNTTYLLEQFNEKHKDNPIEIVYVDNGTDEETVAGLKEGVWDATVMTKRDADKFNATYGDGQDVVKQVGDPVSTSYTYFAFDKDNTELQKAVDGAIKELKESGELAEISRKVIGGDYTESE
ncbi:MAG TPA: transporter substrate-binding domain-containing protein [Lachnospiraceae bacterium]|nr:transporter substrate-binding domain-containing protein [Lachnospiraceae bacterium]